MTEDEFVHRADAFDRLELIDGLVRRHPAVEPIHQELIGRLLFELRLWARGRAGVIEVLLAPLEVWFGPDRILQPDLFVCFEPIPPRQRPVRCRPALCVEILGHDPVFDERVKRYVYAEAGVDEYWLVDPSGQLRRLFGPGLLQAETLDVGDVLVSPVLPGFGLALDELFMRKRR